MTMTTMRAAAVFLLLPFLMAGISAARAQDESELRRTAEAGGEEGRAARYRLAELMLKKDRPAEAVVFAREALRAEGDGVKPAKSARVLLCRAKARLPEEVGDPAARFDMPSAGQQEGLRVGPQLLDVTVTRPDTLQNPKPLHNPAPVDPEGSYRRTPGDVLLQATVDEEGCVREVKVIQGLSPGRNRVAEQAVRGWTFTPGTVDGQPAIIAGLPVLVPFGVRHPGR